MNALQTGEREGEQGENTNGGYRYHEDVTLLHLKVSINRLIYSITE